MPGSEGSALRSAPERSGRSVERSGAKNLNLPERGAELEQLAGARSLIFGAELDFLNKVFKKV